MFIERKTLLGKEIILVVNGALLVCPDGPITTTQISPQRALLRHQRHGREERMDLRHWVTIPLASAEFASFDARI